MNLSPSARSQRWTLRFSLSPRCKPKSSKWESSQHRPWPPGPRQTPRSASWSSSSWSCCSTLTSVSGASRPTARCAPAPSRTAAPWRTSSTTWRTARLARPAKVSPLCSACPQPCSAHPRGSAAAVVKLLLALSLSSLENRMQDLRSSRDGSGIALQASSSPLLH